MRECTYIEGTREALIDGLSNDGRVLVFGHDIGSHGGRFQSTVGLHDRFGARRLREIPSCDRSLIGVVAGAASAGARPILDLTLIDHLLYCVGDCAHSVGTLPALSRGHLPMAIVIRAVIGSGLSAGPFQSGNYHAVFALLPGLRIVAPSSPRDAKGLLAAAIASDEPVMLMEHRRLFAETGPVPTETYHVALDRGVVVRSGTDLTIATYGAMVPCAMHATRLLEDSSISAEVVDLRVLAPLDLETVIASVAKTGRLLLLDDAWGRCSIMAEVAAEVAAHAIDYLDAPVCRLSAFESLVPYSPVLESAVAPTANDVRNAAMKLVSG